jgi:hypothetical protein
MQIANNSQFEDMLTGIEVDASTTTDNMLELTFFLKSNKAVESFLNSTDALKDTVNVAKNDMKFTKVFCRIKFNGLVPSDDIQKALIRLQHEVFDFVSVELLNMQFDSFKLLLQYARDTGRKPVSAVVDIMDNTTSLRQIIAHLIEFNPKNLRFVYHKINEDNLSAYRLIKEFLHGKAITYYAIDCSRRCGLVYENVHAKNIATPVVLKIGFGFNGCCTRYQPAVKDANGRKMGYAKSEIYKFDKESLEYILVPNKNYRKSRYADFVNLNELDLSDAVVSSNPKLKLLLAYLTAA